MTEAAPYTISQLAELAGVTPRTIRYYTAEGLLPRPDTRGQYALYGEQHLLRLQLIGQLKESYLPLGEIKARIEHLDDAQIRALLVEPRESLESPASAADYLAQVRARQQVPHPARRMAEHSEPYAAETPVLSLRPPAAPAPAPPAYGFAAPITTPAPTPHVEEEKQEAAAAPSQQPGLLRKLLPLRPSSARQDSRSAAAAPMPEAPRAEQHWRRIEFAPGVELHIREPSAPNLNEQIVRLIALARELFKADDNM
jgi:DNA-binding transcriptional MerR regulator